MSWAIQSIKFVFALSLLLLVIAYFESEKLPSPSEILPQAMQAPVQSETDTTALNPQGKSGAILYAVDPVFEYELTGLVVSAHHSDHSDDPERAARGGDFLNTIDLCVIWGDNLRSGIYQQMTFTNTAWSCEAAFKDGAPGGQFKMSELSNNHLLPPNMRIEDTLKLIRPGDQVRIKGKLVHYRDRNGEIYRKSSTSRLDSGNGSTEIIYVTSASILQAGNETWRAGLIVCKSLVIGLAIILALYYLRVVALLREVFRK